MQKKCVHHYVFGPRDHETKLSRGVCKRCADVLYLPTEFSQKVFVQALTRRKTPPVV